MAGDPPRLRTRAHTVSQPITATSEHATPTAKTSEPILTPPGWLHPVVEKLDFGDEQVQQLVELQQRMPALLASTDPAYRQEDTAFCNDRCLIRYLRATNWDVDKAGTRIAETLQWRHTRRPHVLDPTYVEPESYTGKLVIDGFDRHGGPVLYITPRLETTKSSRRQIDHLIFYLERAIALMPPGVERLTLVVDFAGSSVFNAPAPWVVKDVIRLLDRHYPERLYRAVVVGSPWYFNQLYKLALPLMDPVTKAKVSIIDLGRHQKRAQQAAAAAPANPAPDDTTNRGSADGDSTTGIVVGKLDVLRRMSLPTGFSVRWRSSSQVTSEHTEQPSSEETGAIESELWNFIPPELLHTSVGGQYAFQHDHTIYWPRLLQQSVHYVPELPADAVIEQ